MILFRSTMNNVNRNRINNYIYRYSTEDKEENFNNLAEVATKKSIIFLKQSYTSLKIVE